MIGSFSTRTESFLWAWSREELAAEVGALRVLGEVRGIDVLATEYQELDQAHAWSMACLAAAVLGADAMYRIPVEHVYWFGLLRNLRLAG